MYTKSLYRENELRQKNNMLESILKSNIEIYSKELDQFLNNFLTGSSEFRQVKLLQLNNLKQYGLKFYFEQIKFESTKSRFWSYITIENIYTSKEIVNVEEHNFDFCELINNLMRKLVIDLKSKLESNLGNREFIRIIEVLVS